MGSLASAALVAGIIPLALVGIPHAAAAQRGAGCERTDTPRPRVEGDTIITESYEDIRGGAEFRCTLNARGAAVRVVLRADGSGIPERLEVHGLARAAGPVQVLRVEAIERPRRGRDFLEGVDMNADGWTDLRVMTWRGVIPNTGFDVFLYDPAARRFARSEVLSAQNNLEPVHGRPCVRTHSVGGMTGRVYDDDELCWAAGRWLRVRSERQVWDERRSTDSVAVFVRTVRVRRGGRMRTVSVRTVRERIR